MWGFTRSKINGYRDEVLQRQKDHHLWKHTFAEQNCSNSDFCCMCAGSNSWACGKIVRWPFDRVVSSYLFALSDQGLMIGKSWDHLRARAAGGDVRNASFLDFL